MNTADDVTKGFTMKMALRSHHRVRDTSVFSEDKCQSSTAVCWATVRAQINQKEAHREFKSVK